MLELRLKETICPICGFENSSKRRLDVIHIPWVHQRKKPKNDIEYVIAVVRNSVTMAEAVRKLRIKHEILKELCKSYGVYVPNPGGRGQRDLTDEEILNRFSKNQKIKSIAFRYLWQLGLKKERCEECGLSMWRNKPLTLEFHHKDGNKDNNEISNIQVLCPNCHSQTDTFRNRKRHRGETGKRTELKIRWQQP